MLKAAGAAFSATILAGAICLAGTEAADAEGVMVICYKQWEAVKAAGTTNGMVWKDFLAQCRAEQKAEPAAAPAAAADSAAAKEVGSQTAAPAPSTQMSAPEPAAPETSSGGTSVGLYYRLIVGGCHFGHQDYRKANRLVKADHDLFPQLRSSSILNSLLSKIKDEAMSSCTAPEIRGLSIDIMAPEPWNNIRNTIDISSIIISAEWDRGTNQFTIQYNQVEHVLGIYEGIVARQHQEDAQKQAEAAAKAEEAAMLEKRRNGALSDCGASPVISGGPWFSSTYKVGADDQASRMINSGQFICVKKIEYVGPAVNPMGGNAARAIFNGYSGQNIVPNRVVADFPY